MGWVALWKPWKSSAAMERALKPPPAFSALFSIGLVQEQLFAKLTRVQLLRKVRGLNCECRDWVDAELRHCDAGGLTMRPSDLLAGLPVPLLRRFASIAGARVVLPPATYELTEEGGGALEISAGVTLVGQKGVVLSGARLALGLHVQTEGVSFESMHLPQGVRIGLPQGGGTAGSLTMTHCTSTGQSIEVSADSSLPRQHRMVSCVYQRTGLG